MLDSFFDNITKIKESGCSFAVEITPCDELIPYINEIKQISMKKLGALPHITIARDESKPEIPILSQYNKEEFKAIWSTFGSKMLEFKLPVFGEKRHEFCYAGVHSFCVDIANGNMSQCYQGESLGNIFENLDEPLQFKAVGKNCPSPQCWNAHSFLLWGDIPNFSELTYADIRNRVCSDGTEWLKPKMKEFMSTKLQEPENLFNNKLAESNNEYNPIKKFWINFKKSAIGMKFMQRITPPPPRRLETRFCVSRLHVSFSERRQAA
jgi:hypothetical protein